MPKLMPKHTHLLYGKVLSAHQTCSWGFIKRDVPKADKPRCSYCPLNTVAQGTLGVQRKSNGVKFQFQAGIRTQSNL